jgi:thioredoxin 1
MTSKCKSAASRLDAALKGRKPVLLEFYADWCPHCQRMMPIVEHLRNSLGEFVEIVQIEGDQHPSLMEQYGADSYPTWIVFKDGREVWRNGGEKSMHELRDALNRYI